MAAFNGNPPAPNPEIYDFESDFNRGFETAFVKLNYYDPAKQEDDKTLITPRVECVFKAASQEQTSYFVPGTLDPRTNLPWAYQHIWNGTLDLTIVTNRKKEDPSQKTQSQLRGTIRSLVQDHATNLTAYMKYLTVIQLLETSTQRSYDQQFTADSSQISFSIRFNIKPSAFPTPD